MGICRRLGMGGKTRTSGGGVRSEGTYRAGFNCVVVYCVSFAWCIDVLAHSLVKRQREVVSLEMLIGRSDARRDPVSADLLYIPMLRLRSQSTVHEAALLEGHPPLGRLPRPIRIQPLDQPQRQLLTHLRQVLAEELCKGRNIIISTPFPSYPKGSRHAPASDRPAGGA